MNNFSTNTFVKLKNEAWFQKQKQAGACVATILKLCKELVDQHLPNTTLESFQFILDTVMIGYECTPTFHNYKGFPRKLCISINEELVHGVYDPFRILKDGDVIKFDLGATFEEAIADAAITCIYGEPRAQEHVRLIKATQDALYAGINAIAVGRHLGVIGNAIYKSVKDTGFGLINNYGGHGIDGIVDGKNVPHAPPFVANKSEPNEGIRIQPGLAIAIEPMCIIGRDVTTTVSKLDNWTVSTPGISSHFEHSIFIKEDKIHIMTEL